MHRLLPQRADADCPKTRQRLLISDYAEVPARRNAKGRPAAASVVRAGNNDQESTPITASMRFFIVEASNGLMM